MRYLIFMVLFLLGNSALGFGKSLIRVKEKCVQVNVNGDYKRSYCKVGVGSSFYCYAKSNTYRKGYSQNVPCNFFDELNKEKLKRDSKESPIF